MKSTVVLLLFLFFNSLLAKDIYFGMYAKKFHVTEKESSLSLTIWADKLNNMDDLGITIKTKLYQDEEELYLDFIKGKVHFASFPSSGYLKYKVDLLKNTQQLFTFSISGHEKFFSYYLINNKNGQLNLDKNTIKNIYFKKNEGTAKLWMDHLMLTKHKLSYKDIFNKVYDLKKQSLLVYKVFFGKENFAVLPKSIYETIVEINPQIIKNVEIIEKSEDIFVSSVGLIHKSLEKEYKDKILLLTMDKKYEYLRKEAFEMSKISTMELIEEKELIDFENMYKAYSLLKRKAK